MVNLLVVVYTNYCCANDAAPAGPASYPPTHTRSHQPISYPPTNPSTNTSTTSPTTHPPCTAIHIPYVLIHTHPRTGTSSRNSQVFLVCKQIVRFYYQHTRMPRHHCLRFISSKLYGFYYKHNKHNEMPRNCVDFITIYTKIYAFSCANNLHGF